LPNFFNLNGGKPDVILMAPIHNDARLFSLFSRSSLMLLWTCNHLRRQCFLFSRVVAIPRPGYTPYLRYSTRPESTDNTDVRHSEFLADAGSGSPWKESQGQSLNGAAADELDKLTTGKGALASMI
jgi:hypothetical protein